MIGSAAARHLGEAGVATALIGPDEPEDRAASAGPFSSHPDEGRITRIAGRTGLWSRLAARSIARYHDIAVRSGIRFHTPVGMAVAGPDLDDWLDSGLIYGSDIRKVDADWLRSSTGIALDNGHPIGFEGPPAGHINPRRLVEAQTRLAEVADATIIREAVTSLERTEGGFEVSGSWGSLLAQRVLLTTGAFGRTLLDADLDVDRRPRSVLLAELAASPNLPSLICKEPPDARLEGIYWVPPVPFPDGRHCLKIGGSLIEPSSIDDEAALVEWFHGAGDEVEVDALEQALRALLPDAEILSTSSTPCVITETASGYPYIGFVEDDLAVAVGGNGSAAKSSDELGRLASSLFSKDGWDDSYEQSSFEPRLR